jgi:hypothetical protein
MFDTTTVDASVNWVVTYEQPTGALESCPESIVLNSFTKSNRTLYQTTEISPYQKISKGDE